jgi:hypothetical protein
MPEHVIIGGAAAYTDADGNERIAWQGETVDLPAAEAERLMELGMLYDEKAAEEAAKAEQDAIDAARAKEDQDRADEAERVAGEKAAAAEAERVAKRGARSESRASSKSE